MIEKIIINKEGDEFEHHDISIDFPFYCEDKLNLYKITSLDKYITISNVGEYKLFINDIDVASEFQIEHYNSTSIIILKSLNNIDGFKVITKDYFNSIIDLYIHQLDAIKLSSNDDLLNLDFTDIFRKYNRNMSIDKLL